MLPGVLSTLGRALVFLGSVLLLFVAFQLWGTGLLQARAQDSLESEFARRLEALGATDEPGGNAGAANRNPGASQEAGQAGEGRLALSATDDAGVAGGQAFSATEAAGQAEEPATKAEEPSHAERNLVTSISQPAFSRSAARSLSAEVSERLGVVYPEDGQALARITIPSIGVEEVVVAGVEVDDLRRGPGHYGSTPLPGQPGNAGIAGHRTTYGAPFGRIDELVPGDRIYTQTIQGTFIYEVTPPPGVKMPAGVGHQIVLPDEVWVLDDFGDNRLTLTSCHPRYSAARRIVVRAVLLGDPVVRLPRPGDEAEPEPPPRLAEETSAAEGESTPPSDEPDSVGGSSGERKQSADDLSAETVDLAETDIFYVPVDDLSVGSRSGAESGAVPAGPSSSPSSQRASPSQPDSGFGTGLDGDRNAVGPAIVWGLAAVAVWLTGALWGRQWRRLPALGVTLVLFLATLFVAFTHIDRALPAF